MKNKQKKGGVIKPMHCPFLLLFHAYIFIIEH